MVHHVNTTDIHHLSQEHCQFFKLPEYIEGIFQMYGLCIKKHFNICSLLWSFGLFQMFAFIFGMLLI